MQRVDSFTDIEERTYVLSTGEIVPLPAFIAEWFDLGDQQRHAERLAFCESHGYDPETWTGCHNCQGVGRDRAGNFCWCCDYGTELERRDADQREREWQANFAAQKHKGNQ